MIDYEEVLSNEQQDICFSNKNLLVKACPGSGKTRTITYKLAHRIEENPDKVKKLVAITYTNRAAEEIEERIENLGINTERIWTGTIHQFCIEWILKRYRMYTNSLKKGFKIIDERVTERYITSIISYYHYNLHWKNIDTGYDRNLRLKEKSTDKKRVIKTYHALLKRNTELDFEQILVTAFNLLKYNPFMANNIRDTIELICIDEYQDTRDLQYAIVEEIANANSNSGFEVNFYGDPNQAIYGSIGGVAKSLAEINNEFSTLKFQECTLNGCYRSTQRIINYYLPYMIENYSIIAKGSNCALKGIIDYNNKLYKDYLSDAIAEIVQNTLNDGIPENEICIIAPEWGLIYPFSRELQEKLPDISFDAPDITPIKRDNMNIFYKISKLLLTDPSIKKIGSRCKLATEILEVLEQYSGRLVEYSILEFLNIINTFRNQSTENIGSKFVCAGIENLLLKMDIRIEECPELEKQFEDFKEKMNFRIENEKYRLSDDLNTFKRMFKEKKGVVINTCHGVKGEEYECVIAFGLLYGKVPNIHTEQSQRDSEAKKLLYVIASRAKSRLFLFSESGRRYYDPVTHQWENCFPARQLYENRIT